VSSIEPPQPPQDGFPEVWPGSPFRAAQPVPSAFRPENDGVHDWQQYRGAVARYKWVVVLVSTVGTLMGVAATRFLRPEYEVQATIWIESHNPRTEDRGPIRGDQLLQASSWLQLLRSFVVLDHVVRDLRLYVTPALPADSDLFQSFEVAAPFRPGAYRLAVDESGAAFTLFTAAGDSLQHAAVGDSIGNGLGFRWTARAGALLPGRVVDFTAGTPRGAAEQLARRLRAKTDEAGNFLSVQLTGSDARHVTAVLNAVVQRYVAVAADLKRDKLTELSKILQQQLQYAEHNLRSAEEVLADFRVQTITLPADRVTAVAPGLELTRDPGVAAFFNMKVEREQLRRDREAIELALAQAADSAASWDALSVIGSVQQSPGLMQALKELTDKQAEQRALGYRYTADFSRVGYVREQVDTLERKTIPGLARALIRELATRESVGDARVRLASQDLRQIPPRAIQEGRLRREAAIAENLFTTLQQRYEEARLAEASSIPDVRVLDVATPPLVPVRNTAPGVILGAFLGSMALGLVGVVRRDRADPRVRCPEQVTHDIGLPILGVLPHVKVRGAGPEDEHVAQVIEAMRSVRLSLSQTHGGSGPMLVTVSSPGIGDGKSFVSANLALAYSGTGQRTLLIDGDVRRGSLHRAMLAQRTPGLTDVLAKRAPLERVTQATNYTALEFISAGTHFRDAPELLGSDAMVELVTRLRGAYGVILLDSPPLASGVDPYTLGMVTGSLLLVLRTGATSLELARTKLRVLDRLPIRLLGVVVNDVRPRGVYRYHSYLSGYGTADEAEYAMGPPRVRGVL